MISQIDVSNIDSNFPVENADNPSQGFRDNFNFIKIALSTAKNEITQLQNFPVGVSTATSNSQGTVIVGAGLEITNNGVLSVTNVLPSYTVATLTDIINPVAGMLVYVTDAPGAAQPCFYNGTNWFTISTLTQL